MIILEGIMNKKLKTLLGNTLARTYTEKTQTKCSYNEKKETFTIGGKTLRYNEETVIKMQKEMYAHLCLELDNYGAIN